jgi:hypothetical protein
MQNLTDIEAELYRWHVQKLAFILSRLDTK